MKFRTEGLIIKEQNIGEQDKLIHVLTKSNGVVKAFARGAKSLKNGKSAATSLLSYSLLTFHTGRESYTVGDARAIHIFSKLRADVKKMCLTIGDARSLHIFSKLRRDVKKMCLAQYFCELALTICPREKNAEKYLSLVLNSLYLIDESKRSEELVKPCLEMRLAAMAGYLPDLVMCRGCGVYAAPTMFFFPQTGAIECSSCRSGSDGAIPLSEAALTALRHTVYADDDKLFSFSLNSEGLEQLNRASEAYLKYRFEKDFKTLNFYKAIT